MSVIDMLNSCCSFNNQYPPVLFETVFSRIVGSILLASYPRLPAMKGVSVVSQYKILLPSDLGTYDSTSSWTREGSKLHVGSRRARPDRDTDCKTNEKDTRQ